MTAFAQRHAISDVCILTADIDVAACVRGKFDFDVVGHYARPDVFKLSVNESPATAVRFESGGQSE